MTTYFVAGYSQFSNGDRWTFFRVVNWTDSDTPQEMITKIIEEQLENNFNNYKTIDNYSPPEKGELIITAFNKV